MGKLSISLNIIDSREKEMSANVLDSIIYTETCAL